MNGNCDDVPIRSIPPGDRLKKLSEHYYNEFGNEPDFFARVPGRVNLIGEHIDYCGYPVLPMALEQDIIVAAGFTKQHNVYLRNTNCKYDGIDFEIKPNDEIIIESGSDGKPFWYNYVLCGIKGALEHLNNKVITGLRLYVDGNIPPASGLSSSSALVSAVCLAFLYAQDVTLNKTEIASLCANCERYIGTQGGGMDQAIAFLAEKYCAQYISWNPLKATKVMLPIDATFVVAHSLAEVNKAATNDYNKRVIECRLAAKVLLLDSQSKKNHNIVTLSEVQNSLNKTLEDMVNLVHVQLPKEIYEKSEVCKMLKITEDEMDEFYLTPNTIHLKEFKLKQRALHVYGEAMRVEEFRKICAQSMNGKSNGSTNGVITLETGDKNEVLDNLGELMSKSHESLKELYECSHKNLDILVDISKRVNVHSRLTGAGWGGCIVALCSKEQAKDYIEKLEDEFYVKHCNIDKAKAKQYVFATSPNYGAVIYARKYKA